MAARWQDHILGPDTTGNRPNPTTVPERALYADTDDGVLYINIADTWEIYRVPASGLTDPTTTKGDLLIRGAAAISRLGIGSDKAILVADSTQTLGVKWTAQPVEYAVAVSDETTVITTGTAKVTFRMPFAMTLTAVRASLTAASSGSGPVTVDINESGISILSTKLTIDDTEKSSTTAAAPAVISDADLADDAEITIDINTAGTGAKGLKVTLIGTRA